MYTGVSTSPTGPTMIATFTGVAPRAGVASPGVARIVATRVAMTKSARTRSPGARKVGLGPERYYRTALLRRQDVVARRQRQVPVGSEADSWSVRASAITSAHALYPTTDGWNWSLDSTSVRPRSRGGTWLARSAYATPARNASERLIGRRRRAY